MEYLRSLAKYRFFNYSPAHPFEGFKHITSEIDNFNLGMGVSMFNRKHNLVNFRFIFGITCLVMYTISIVLSSFWFRHEITKLIFCIATFGFGCQATMKIYCYIITRHRVVDLHEINSKYYKSMMHQSERVKSVLCQSTSLTYIVLKGTVLVYSILVLATLTLPGLSAVFLTSRILPFGFILPLIDVDTWAGYIWNYIFQLSCTYYYWLISVGSDLATISNLLTAYGQLDALMIIIDEFDEQLARDEPLAVIRRKMVDIIQLHQYHRSYLQQLVDFLNPYHFVTVGSIVPTMVISVLGFVLLDWYPGAVIMFFGSLQIFYVCFLGTGLEVKTDELVLKVGAIHWNKLSVRDMKHMNLMLAMTQQTKGLFVATTPLNVTTYLQIHKFMYSLIMMLENTKD